MLRRTTIRTRVLVGLAPPAFALVLIVALNLRRSVGLGVLVGAVIALGLVVAIAAARSISRPLTVLAAQAADVNVLQRADSSIPVDELLPQGLTDHGYGGEIGQLANAIATGRKRALQTVVDQREQHRTLREMATNSAERTSGVLTTALSQIDELARRDHDAATATSLASVQRMVARADRHTGGVLVLLGRDTPKVERDTSLTEVLWAACLAVDAADRIDFVSMSEAYVRSDAVNDLAHLLAEMLENAAHATGETSRVTVLGEANDIGYLVTVVDHGGGMDAVALAESNRRVSRAVPAEIVPARALGLDVVGRLARRQGILVRLGESSDGGIVVRVEIPASVLAEAPVIEAPGVEDAAVEDAPIGDAPRAEIAAEDAPVEVEVGVEVGVDVDLNEEHEVDEFAAAAEAAAAAAVADVLAPPAAALIPEVVGPHEGRVGDGRVVDAHGPDRGQHLDRGHDLEPIEVEITAPTPMSYPSHAANGGAPSIVIDPMPYVVKVHRPHDELLPSGQRKKRWAAALAKAGQ
jgi:signal transduction histidine kinase